MGTPVPLWEGIPVMPGAIEGRPAGLSYVYSVDASLTDVESYYLDQMRANGWGLDNRQSSETSLFGGPAVVLDFGRGGEQANVMIIYSARGNYTMVMLTFID